MGQGEREKQKESASWGGERRGGGRVPNNCESNTAKNCKII